MKEKDFGMVPEEKKSAIGVKVQVNSLKVFNRFWVTESNKI